MQDFNIGQSFVDLWNSTGFSMMTWQQLVMLLVSCLLLYLAIVKKYEPLLLVPIAFGMLLANLPGANMMGKPYELVNLVPQNLLSPDDLSTKAVEAAQTAAQATGQSLMQGGNYVLSHSGDYANGGLLYYLYQGVKLGIYPPLIFLGVGAMTDFAPLIANPKSLLLGAAAQLGIFITFIGALLLGFTNQEAGSIGIIGGADGPTAIYLTTKLAPHLLGPIAVAAYSYMALVPVIQPPIMKALTTKKERMVVMEQLREVSKTERIIFPIVVTIFISLLLPAAAPLIGMLMLGNLFRESLVVDRLNKTAQNELINIVTIFLGVTVGATANGETFLQLDTIKIILLGLFAFGCGTAGGVLLGKLMYKLSGGKINPLIGSAGVSAVPMAARVSQKVGQQYNPGNFLLMHAMGPNVAGVIGSAVAAGVLLSLFG
jgi:oxaloacetate decarboxylase beta subunit